jgi:hypothetical protein
LSYSTQALARAHRVAEAIVRRGGAAPHTIGLGADDRNEGKAEACIYWHNGTTRYACLWIPRGGNIYGALFDRGPSESEMHFIDGNESAAPRMYRLKIAPWMRVPA